VSKQDDALADAAALRKVLRALVDLNADAETYCREYDDIMFDNVVVADFLAVMDEAHLVLGDKREPEGS